MQSINFNQSVMKNLSFTIIALLLTVATSWAKPIDYTPSIIGSVWSYTHLNDFHTFTDIKMYYYYTFMRYTVLDRPTLFNGTTYYPCMQYETCDFSEDEAVLAGYLRQDGDKIYQYIDSTNTEILLFDFSLEEGDTLRTTDENITIKIGKADTVTNLDGKDFETTSIRYGNDSIGYVESLRWIKHIGNYYSASVRYSDFTQEVRPLYNKTKRLNYYRSGDGKVIYKNAVNIVKWHEEDFLEDDCAIVWSQETFPVDMTSLIINPTYESGAQGDVIEGWKGTSPNFSTYRNAEHNSKTFDSWQMLENLPNGVYKLTVQGFYRPSDTSPDKPVFYAANGRDSLTTPVPNILQEGTSENNIIPDNSQQANEAFVAGKYVTTLQFVVTDHKVRFGIAQNKKSGEADWVVWDNWQLTYYGNEGAEAIEYVIKEQESAQVHPIGQTILCTSPTATKLEVYTMDAVKVGEADFANGEATVKVDKVPATYLYIVTNPDGRRESGKVVVKD